MPELTYELNVGITGRTPTTCRLCDITNFHFFLLTVDSIPSIDFILILFISKECVSNERMWVRS